MKFGIRFFLQWLKYNFPGSYTRYKEKMERQDRKLRAKGKFLLGWSEPRLKMQDKCSHRKGGQVLVGNKLNSKFHEVGDDSQYAVLKHTFANGDTWVRCLRCGKTWKPPVKSDFKNNQEGYTSAMEVYKQALQFQTRNVPSKGIVFSYGEGGVELYRENTKNANLR